MKEVGLDMLIPGEKGTVGSFSTPAFEVRHRLMEMGLTKGTIIEVIRLAPLGDPNRDFCPGIPPVVAAKRGIGSHDQEG